MSYRSNYVMLRVVLVLVFLLVFFTAPLDGQAVAAPVSPQSVPGRADVQVASIAETAAQVHVQGDGITGVRHYLNPELQAFESSFEGMNAAASSRRGEAASIDTSALPNGVHTLITVIDYEDGRKEIRTSRFVVYNGPAALLFGPEPLAISVVEGGRVERTLELLTSAGNRADYELTADVPWLRFEGAAPTLPATTGVAPGRHVLEVDASGLTPGVHTATITAEAAGLVPASMAVQVEVLAPAADCTPLDCSQVKVNVPYLLTFDHDHGGLKDVNNVGTGFTWVDKPTGAGGTGYIPANLLMDLGAGVLKITTTSGGASGGNNNQDNALGVGLAAANQISVLDTRLVNMPVTTGNFEQAGLWYGVDDDNYVKVALASEPSGMRVQFVEERAGVVQQQVVSGPINLGGAAVHLRLRANPATRQITGYFGLNDGPLTELSTFTVPGLLFNADGAGIDPTLGTRVFGGIYATDRFRQVPLTYSFDSFSVTTGGNPAEPGTFGWDRKSFPASFPSSMVLGPDGRLYFTETFGVVRAVGFNSGWDVTSNDVIYTFSGRLVLGITVDPASTAQSIILWIAHSDGSMSGGMFTGAVNSGMVSKLTGPAWAREDVITGLPRALANHSTNSLHFGPDGKLYIAQGGNTGAGAPNNTNTEFGTRAEQPLSAALLVADVKAPGFDGSCATPEETFGPSPCDVTTYATGMRNMYDFVFHSNGSIYGPDNGLGVDGTFPPQPTPVCTGLANPALWTQGGHNPGVQSDELMRIEQGKYYGHPNPYRNECVFKSGSFQSAAPLPNYVAPIFDLGMSKSANGIIEYKSTAFGDLLKGNLLITNYSTGDNITRVKLTPDGLNVELAESLVGDFNDPLPILEGPNGILFVGEHGPSSSTGKITILTPRAVGSWTAKAPLPSGLLDAGSAVVGGKLYVVAGKDGVGPKSTLHIYDPVSNSWSMGAAVPAGYPAVENPAAAELNGKLYVFGGSQQPFSGAVPNAAVYDPASNTWTELAPMAIARGGATAKALNSKIYVAGGMGNDGASINSVEIYDPASNTWTNGPEMLLHRDNPGSAVLGGKLYVFGGRTRFAAGGEVASTPTSVEMFDPAMGVWTSKASMPKGRRTPVVGVIGGKALVVGGENNNETYNNNEEYDPATDSWRLLTPMPTARHGAAGGVINNVLYVVGGSTTSGISATAVNEAFSFGAAPPVTYPYKLYLPIIRR
jgi:large repetitive protein